MIGFSAPQQTPAPRQTPSGQAAASAPENRALAEPALIIGGAILLATALCAPRLPRWAADYGAALVYTALFMTIAVAVGLARWGVLTRWTGYGCGNHRNEIGHRR
jgi:hypothetical protein